MQLRLVAGAVKELVNPIEVKTMNVYAKANCPMGCLLALDSLLRAFGLPIVTRKLLQCPVIVTDTCLNFVKGLLFKIPWQEPSPKRL
jgi:hypothetical protein